ncbi:MAG: hypothetical protein N2Z20_04075 [Elusimicrobiales bacterium]|nr:hypothetical protein [Elusimicrobiales bacterium]
MKFLTVIIALFITTSLFSEENTKKLFANFSTNLEGNILDDISQAIITIIERYYDHIDLNGMVLEKPLNIALDYYDSNYYLIEKASFNNEFRRT